MEKSGGGGSSVNSGAAAPPPPSEARAIHPANGGAAWRPAAVILGTRKEELEKTKGVSLGALPFPPDLALGMKRLGIETIGRFLELPAGALLERFGPEAYRWRQFLSGEPALSTEPVTENVPLKKTLLLEEPLGSLKGVLEEISRLLLPLHAETTAADRRLREIRIVLSLEDEADVSIPLQPSGRRMSAEFLLSLVRLRLESLRIPAPVTALSVELLTESAKTKEEDDGGNFEEFFLQAAFDPAEYAETLDSLRAELGEDSVVRARLLDRHLPEKRFIWEPFRVLPDFGSAAPLLSPPSFPGSFFPDQSASSSGAAILEPLSHHRPASPESAAPVLIRRFFQKPIPLLKWSSFAGSETGAPVLGGGGENESDIEKRRFRISGGWCGSEMRREYRLLETREGELLWIFFDEKKRDWIVQARVE